jgi:hypothetical protein
MAPTKIAVNFRERRLFLNVVNDEPLWHIKNTLELLCGINLDNDDYALEIYDSELQEYVVLSQPYLTEIYNNILCTSDAILQVQIRSLQSECKFIRIKKNGFLFDFRHLSMISRNLENVSIDKNFLCLDCASIESSQLLDYFIVWCDKNIGDSRDCLSFKLLCAAVTDMKRSYYLDDVEQTNFEDLICLEEVPITKTVKYFNNVDDCLTFIEIHCTSKIFLVTSNTFGRLLTPKVLSKLYSIYLFGPRVENRFDWLSDYPDLNITVIDLEMNLVVSISERYRSSS